VLRRESLPPVGRGLLRGPSAEVVLFDSRESPPAADRGALRNSLSPSVREVLRGPPCAGVRLVVRKPPLADVRPPPADVRPPPADVRPPPADVRPPPADVRPPLADVRPPLADVRLPSRGPSPAAGRDARRVPSPVRAAGLRPGWPRPYPLLAPAVLPPREAFGFPPLAPLPLGVPGPSATLTNLQTQDYPDKRRGPLDHIGSDPLQTCPAASYSPTRSPAQYHRR
jgi:hypothetical protein